MRRIIYIAGLELYAIALALLRFMTGLHTDEAKYLLNIAYPHPPLARFILSLTKTIPQQELLIRIIFASLVVQGVWLVYSMTSDKILRRLLCCAWLASPAVLLQAGTIMMAPLTGLSGFVFLVAAVQSQRINAEKDAYFGKRQAFFLGLFWLASLFTAYQAVLFLPLIMAAFVRSSIARWKAAVYIIAPLVILILYTLTNPLAIASMGNAATENGAFTLLARATNAGLLWLYSGGVVFGAAGLIGIVVSRRIEMIAAFVLVVAYCTLSYHEYYAILLVPFFLFGILTLVQKLSRKYILAFAIIGTATSLIVAAYFMRFSFADHSPVPRQVMAQLRKARPVLFDASAAKRTMLMVGTFGHDWQYESPFEIRKYAEKLQTTQADVLVCLQACDEKLTQGMAKVDEVRQVEMYVR